MDPVKLGELVERRALLREHSLEKLLTEFGTSPTIGLPSGAEGPLRAHFGENFIAPKLPHGLLYYVGKAMQDYMLIFLLVGGAVVFVAEMVREPHSYGVDGLAIILAVFIIVAVTSLNDYSKERKFRDLARSIRLGATCTVLRAGNPTEIPTKDLVVGDVYLPKYGDQVPADAVILRCDGLRVDESAVTGESDLVLKDPKNVPYLFASTYVMDGAGAALVVAVGINSQTGRIMRLLGATRTKKKNKEEAPKKARSVLQEKLTKLALLLGKVGVSAGVAVFAIQVIRYSVANFAGVNARSFESADLFSYLDLLLQGFTVVVVAVPEGLPLAVTVSLAYSVIRMLKDKNLVRQLYSCETMGNATTICSDKTGTLTTNRMTAVQAYFSEFRVTNLKEGLELSKTQIEAIIMNICVNKSPSSALKPSEVAGAPPVQLGNKTDCALLGFLSNLGTSFQDFSDKFAAERVLRVFPFNSEKKMMTAIVDFSEGIARVLVKGAPDILLAKCTRQFDSSGNIIEMTPQMRDLIKTSVTEMAVEALRTIVLAYCDVRRSEVEGESESKLVGSLIFTALFGIEDPVRPDVPEAIRSCQKAGITVRMVTGDNINTARSVAMKCGILGSEPDELILDSAKFNRLVFRDGRFDQGAFDKVWPRLRVLARSSPNDKYVLVTGILSTHLSPQVVAVTGDGTNDAPALRAADVGFAMGLTGTDIAKEACDIIITDDNFSNIVSAVLWGRNVYDCISRFLVFQLTVNLSAVTLCVLFSMVWFNVFSSLQLLWVNLVMDTLASLALATDRPTRELLDRKPYARNRSLLSRFMVTFIIFHAAYQVLLLMLLAIFGGTWFGVEDHFALNAFRDQNRLGRVDTQHATLVYNVFVLMQIFNELNARKVHGERNVFQHVLKNRLFVGIFLIEIALQVIIVQFGSTWFRVVALSAEQWLWSIFLASSVLLFHQAVVVVFSKVVPFPQHMRITHGIASSLVIAEEPHDFDPQLLWIRGLKKLQTQLRVIDAFKENLTLTSALESPVASTDENKAE